jgi:FkbM family methyltransferase
MRFVPDLVFDVGMHNGDDTAYYLHKGYRVVAVEANPELVPAAGRRFAAAITAGRLYIENVAIAAERGEVDLWVSARHDLLGSTSRENAARFGGQVRAVRVPCRPLGELTARHGVPFYLKVDIEGSDRLCLEALGPPDLPQYVSVEMDHACGDADIGRLAELGYVRFQCIRQNDFAAIHPGNLPRQLALRRLRARGGPLGLAVGATRRAARALRPARDGDWRFRRGMSGPFGPALPGPWLTAADMLATWRALHDVDAELGAGGVGEWFDVHAGR